MRQYAIAVVVGSLRKESVNRQLAQALIELAPAELSLKLLDVDLPLFNQDKENACSSSRLPFRPPMGWSSSRPSTTAPFPVY